MRKIIIPFVIFCAIVSYLSFAQYKESKHPKQPESEFSWDWDQIDLDEVLDFPPDFWWGASDSETQMSGTEKADGSDSENTWTEWEEQHDLPLEKRCQQGNHHKRRYLEDAKLLADFGFNIRRLSLGWDKIEPEPDVYDINELDWHVKEIDALISCGIKPMICFFHHATPLWFDEKGGFEKRKNIKYFVSFVKICYQYIRNHVKHPEQLDYVLTFNEPVGWALASYYKHTLPPGKKSLQIAGQVVRNVLDAHAAAYDALHKLYKNINVGAAFVFHPLDPSRPRNLLDITTSYVGNYLLHDVRMTYLKTGYFSWVSPSVRDIISFVGLYKSYNPKVKNKIDFVGVNYYSRRFTQGLKVITIIPPDGETSEEKNDEIYPEGLYRSIKMAAEWGKPIIVLENGIPTKNDALKDLYVRQHLYAVHRALQHGYDVRGYFWWAPIDLFSWHSGYSSYGFYGVDYETKDRFLRHNAAAHFMKTIAQSKQPVIENSAISGAQIVYC
jgi:beta-glucosidase